MSTVHQMTREANRRLHDRQKLPAIAYIQFGPDNGGIVIDVSEGGLSCQVVGPVIEGEICHTKFILPGSHAAIQGNCQVVWSNRTKKGGGLRFVDFSEEALCRVRNWVLNETPAESIKKGPVLTRATTLRPVQNASVLREPIQTDPSELKSPDPVLQGVSTVAPTDPIASAEIGRSEIGRSTASATVLPTAILPAGNVAAPEAIPVISKRTSQKPLQAPLATDFSLRAALAVPPPDAGSLEKRQSFLPIALVKIIAGAAVIMVLAVTISQYKRIAGWFGDVVLPRDATAGIDTSSDSAASSAPINAAASNFQVEVIDVSGRSFILTNSGAVRKPPVIDRTVSPEVATPKEPVEESEGTFSDGIVPRVGEVRKALAPIHLATAAKVPYYQPAELLRRVEPKYPVLGKGLLPDGPLRISALIGKDGIPRQVSRLSGDILFSNAAIAAIGKWRYNPAHLGSQAVESQTVITIQFQQRP